MVGSNKNLWPHPVPGYHITGMKTLGIDFTSRPTRGKPLTYLTAELQGDQFIAGSLQEWTSSGCVPLQAAVPERRPL